MVGTTRRWARSRQPYSLSICWWRRRPDGWEIDSRASRSSSAARYCGASRPWARPGFTTFGIFAPAVIADFYPERDRNRILSIFYLAIPVGAALGYVAGGELGTIWGWRAPFFICAIPGFVIAALYAGFGREPVRGSSDHVRSTADRATVFGIFRNPAFLTATMGLATLTFAMGGISAWMPTFLHRVAGLSVANSSLT